MEFMGMVLTGRHPTASLFNFPSSSTVLRGIIINTGTGGAISPRFRPLVDLLNASSPPTIRGENREDIEAVRRIRLTQLVRVMQVPSTSITPRSLRFRLRIIAAANFFLVAVGF